MFSISKCQSTNCYISHGKESMLSFIIRKLFYLAHVTAWIVLRGLTFKTQLKHVQVQIAQTNVYINTLIYIS